MIKLRYFIKRNIFGILLALLILVEMSLNNKGVHQQALLNAQARIAAEIDSLKSSDMARLLMKQALERSNYLAKNNETMNSLNALAVSERRADAKAYNESVAKNDSSYHAAIQAYVAWVKQESQKIEQKYERVFIAGDDKIPVTGRTGFAMMIPLLGFVGVWLFSKSHRLNKDTQDARLAIFEMLGGFVAISSQVASGIMIFYCIALWFDSQAYAVFGAIAWAAGVLATSACTTLIDRQALAAEMAVELEAKSAAQQIRIDAAPEKRASMLAIFSEKGPLDFSLARYNGIDDMPLSMNECAKVYAAFLHQRSVVPEWLSYSSVGAHLAGKGVSFAKSSFSSLVKLWREKKAA